MRCNPSPLPPLPQGERGNGRHRCAMENGVGGFALITAIFLLVAFVAIGLLRWPLVPVLFTLAPLSVLAAWLRRA